MKSIFVILLSIISFGVFAQAKPAAKPATAAGDCFKEWYTLFKERGANPIPDGTQDVIITLRGSSDYSECFIGKIDVVGGRIVSKLQVQKVDGSYEEFDKRVSAGYQDASTGVLKESLRDVTNGMSESITLTDGETIRLFFYKYLADKVKANKKAPSAASLVKI
jgi:hypothetical protein